MKQPAVVCVCCQLTEVAWYELICVACRPTLEAVGVIASAEHQDTTKPFTDQRTQIGPSDI